MFSTFFESIVKYVTNNVLLVYGENLKFLIAMENKTSIFTKRRILFLLLGYYICDFEQRRNESNIPTTLQCK